MHAGNGASSGSFHCQGWRGEHQGYVRRAGRRASRSAPPVSTVVTAASQWQPAVTDEVSASELCWKWSRMKSQLLSSGWQRTPWVLKSKSQLPEQPKKKYLNTSMRTAVHVVLLLLLVQSYPCCSDQQEDRIRIPGSIEY